MRVVHVNTGVAKAIVGVDTHILTLAAAQKERGISAMVINDQPGYLTEACDQRGIPVAVERGLNPQGRAFDTPPEKTLKFLADMCANFGANVIHCHSQAAAVAFFSSDLAKFPCVFTHHNVWWRFAAGGAQKWGSRFAIICVSRAGLEFLKKSGVPRERLYYVPNGTPPPEDTAASRSSRPNLVLAGALSPVKGIDIAILAMHVLRERHGQACPVLNIYGAGQNEKFFKEMATALGLTDIVRFHGVQARILERCPNTDILMVASRAEAGPIVVLEAMSRGMPIVASKVGEVSEMLPDERYGRIVPVESMVGLADAVDSLLSDISNGRFDPRLLIARHRSFYTADKMAERIEPIYQNAMLNRRTTRRPAEAGVPGHRGLEL